MSPRDSLPNSSGNKAITVRSMGIATHYLMTLDLLLDTAARKELMVRFGNISSSREFFAALHLCYAQLYFLTPHVFDVTGVIVLALPVRPSHSHGQTDRHTDLTFACEITKCIM